MFRPNQFDKPDFVFFVYSKMNKFRDLNSTPNMYVSVWYTSYIFALFMKFIDIIKIIICFKIVSKLCMIQFLFMIKKA